MSGIYERLAALEAAVFGKGYSAEPKNPHKWYNTYSFGGHYPDGRVCSECGIEDTVSGSPNTPKECGGSR